MYYAGLGTFVSDHDLYALFQSDLGESLDFFLTYICRPAGLAVAGTAFAVSLAAMRAVLRRAQAKADAGKRKKRLLLAALALGLGLTAFAHISVVSFTYTQYYQYYRDLNQFNRLYAQLAQERAGDAVKQETGELYVLVIGESQNKDLMSCYGAPFASTPWLAEARSDPEFIFLENAYSAHVLTMQVISAAFFDGNMRSGDTFPEGQNLLQVFKKAGFATVWLSNQRQLGRRDNIVSALAQTAGKCIFSVKAGPAWRPRSAPDEVLLPSVAAELGRVDFSGNTLLIVHLMGNHFPYKDRYPAGYSADIPEADVLAASFAKVRDPDKLRQYLASLRYADRVLKQLTGLVRAYADKPVLMVYFSDHGEEVLDNREGGHNPAAFTWEMARIPFFIWTSAAWRERYPERVAALRANASSAFCNDLLFDLFLGLGNLKTTAYQPELDLSHRAYRAEPGALTIFNGKPVSEDPQYDRRPVLARPAAEKARSSLTSAK